MNGLSDKEVLISREKYGSNELEKVKKENIFIKLIKVLKEPTLLLLILASSVYFILGEYIDGIIMLCCVIFTCMIEFIQQYKTSKAVLELNKLTMLNVDVIRNGKKVVINSCDLVVGDLVLIEEGDQIPADGVVVELQGLGLNESALTGEADVVYKSLKEDDNYFKSNICYKGSYVVTGNAVIRIVSVGKNTEYGKIGRDLNNIKEVRTPLQNQVNKVVYIYAVISLLLFLSIMAITFVNNSNLILKDRFIASLLSGITIAMATIPEEIPVVLAVFLALGTADLAKKNTLTKNMRSVENLGKITVLCTDKTGTITENKMKVKDVYIYNNNFYEASYLSCLEKSYDNMEIALKKYCLDNKKITKYKLKHEFVFNNEDKMMGLILENNVLYVKGAYESVIKLCSLKKEEVTKINKKVEEFSKLGLRVIAVGTSENVSIKENLKDYKLEFQGLVAFVDPIRKGIENSIKECLTAGIKVMMITGDSAITAKSIGDKLGLKGQILTGEEIEVMSDEELKNKVKDVIIFARVYPNHKKRIVDALQANGEVVAMTGDGINDASALKKADIGIAMGTGTSVSKESADIILLDDNFNTIALAVKNGRNIYNNIKKAISYILAIHIPIALLALVIPLLKLPVLLLPVHIVLLELLIDPTSSIIFQRIKCDENIMKKPPRDKSSSIIDLKTLLRCIVQGLIVFIAVFITYVYLTKISVFKAVSVSYSLLILSIIMIAYSFKSKKMTIINIIDGFKDKVVLLVNGIIILVLICLIYTPVFHDVANTSGIGLLDWIYILVVSVLITVPFDLLKKD